MKSTRPAKLASYRFFNFALYLVSRVSRIRSVVDLACGSCQLYPRIIHCFPDISIYYAIDNNITRLKTAKSLFPFVTILQKDLSNLLAPLPSSDLYICSQLFGFNTSFSANSSSCESLLSSVLSINCTFLLTDLIYSDSFNAICIKRLANEYGYFYISIPIIPLNYRFPRKLALLLSFLPCVIPSNYRFLIFWKRGAFLNL